MIIDIKIKRNKINSYIEDDDHDEGDNCKYGDEHEK